VFRMALDAGIIAPAATHQGRMEPSLGGQPLCDFEVACRTSELACAASANVAACAVCRTLEFVMRSRHCSGRKLAKYCYKTETKAPQPANKSWVCKCPTARRAPVN
jgi:hypothetical protein